METRENIITPPNCLHANLRRATRTIAKHYSETLKPTQVERTQITLLFVIRGMGEVTISQLGNVLHMDQTTATRGVQALGRKGFVTLEQGDDKRTRYIVLTEQGKAALKEASPYWNQAQSAVVDALGPEKATQLLDLLDELVAALTKK